MPIAPRLKPSSPAGTQQKIKPYQIKRKVNGKPLVMLKDTGCTQTLLHSSLVLKKDLIPD